MPSPTGTGLVSSPTLARHKREARVRIMKGSSPVDEREGGREETGERQRERERSSYGNEHIFKGIFLKSTKACLSRWG
jgi:hypothetical protein